ncbi:MAG: hypothetical protein GC129_05500 [Proteobacteria bacterium]|nr:hypothetical protein [Pseudomonadota bacterium]
MTLPEALETLQLLPDWESRYAFIIELAKQLPPMPQDEKVPANIVRGCTSQVWLTHSFDANTHLHLNLDSDALIVRGLLALVHLAYNNQPRAQLAAINLPSQLAQSKLLEHLSPNRRNGFASVVATVSALS